MTIAVRAIGKTYAIVRVVALPALLAAGQLYMQCHAQPAGTPHQPVFEVVSLKYAGPGPARETGLRRSAGRVTGTVSLSYLLQSAFDVSHMRVVGPESALKQIYEVAALEPPGTQRETRPLMLQRMLIDRLGLKYHLEERATEIYALEVANGSPKLTVATEGRPARFLFNPGEFKQRSASMADFVFFLTGQFDREVVDFTGLTGRYVFNLDWHSEDRDPSIWVEGSRGMTRDPRMLTRVLKSIGLKLTAKKVPLKYLVVDHVNKIPTPN